MVAAQNRQSLFTTIYRAATASERFVGAFLNKLLVLLPAAVLLCSCHVKNQVYNQTPRSIVAIETSGQQPDRVDPQCNPDPNASTPHACMAFIEFDEMG